MSRRERTTVALAALVAALVLPLGAAEPPAEKPGAIAHLWLFWPKTGEEQKFEAAAKAHVAWRKQAGEAYVWEAYQPVVGDDLTFYVYRAGDLHWADLDANAAWAQQAKADERYQADVAPHVARAEHYITETDFDHSLWHPAEDYRLFRVDENEIRPGAYGDFEQALTKVHKAAVDGKWPRSYSVAWRIGGPEMLQVVFPYRSWSEMATPDPSFMKVLAQSVGSEEAAGKVMSQLSGAFSSSKTTVFAFRQDLCTPR